MRYDEKAIAIWKFLKTFCNFYPKKWNLFFFSKWIDRRERFSLSSIPVKVRRPNTSMSSKILNFSRILPMKCWYLLIASSWSISQIIFSAFKILWYALCCLLCCFLALAPTILKITFFAMRLTFYYTLKWMIPELKKRFDGLVSQSNSNRKEHKRDRILTIENNWDSKIADCNMIYYHLRCNFIDCDTMHCCLWGNFSGCDMMHYHLQFIIINCDMLRHRLQRSVIAIVIRYVHLRFSMHAIAKSIAIDLYSLAISQNKKIRLISCKVHVEFTIVSHVWNHQYS